MVLGLTTLPTQAGRGHEALFVKRGCAIPPVKDFLAYPKKELKDMILEDFRASEAHRSDANLQNWYQNKYFHCRDLDQPLITPQTTQRDNRPLNDFGNSEDDLEDAFIENSMFLPYLRSVLLTALAITVNTLFPDYEHYIEYSANDPEDEEKVATSAFAMIRMLKEGGYPKEVVKTILQSFKYDVALIYVGYKREYGWIPEKIEPERMIQNWLSGKMFKSGEKGDAYIRYRWAKAAIDGLDVKSINTFNLRYEPWAQDEIDKAQWIGLTYRMPKARMHELARHKAFDPDVVAKIKDDEPINENERDDEAQDYERMIHEDQKLDPDASPTDGQDKNYVRIMDYFTKNGVATLVNGKHVVRHRRTLGFPFRRVVAYNNEGSFAGESMAYPLMGIQADLNTMYRMQRDQQDLAANPIPVIDLRFFNSKEEVESITFDPREPIILTRTPPGADSRYAVFFLVPPGNTAPDIFASSSAALQMGERAMGVSDNSQGVARPGNRTATEAMQMQQGVATRQDFQSKMYEDELVVGVHQDSIKLVMLFGSKVRRFRIKRKAGVDFVTFHPTDLLMKENPDLVPMGTITRRFLQASGDLLQNAILIASTNPLFAQYFNGLEGLKTLLRHTNAPGWEKLVNDDSAGLGGTLDQGDENILLAAGKFVPISAADDHQQHINILQEFLTSDAFLTVPVEHLEKFKEHMQLHIKATQMAAQTPQPVAGAGGGGVGAIRAGNIGGGLAVGAPNMSSGPQAQLGSPASPGASTVAAG